MQPLMDAVEMTAAYTNALLVAVLPYITEFAERLDLRIERPVTPQHVAQVEPFQRPLEVMVDLELTNGFLFTFCSGRVATYWGIERLRDATRLGSGAPSQGGARDAAELVAKARDTLRRLGYDLEEVYADLEPQEVALETLRPDRSSRDAMSRAGWQAVHWSQPYSENATSVTICFSRETGRLEHLDVNSNLSRRPPPKLSVEPTFVLGLAGDRIRANEMPRWREQWPISEQVGDHLRRILPDLQDFARRFPDLGEPGLGIDQVRRCEAAWMPPTNAVWCRITLTNGWRLYHGAGRVHQARAPDEFYGPANRYVDLDQWFDSAGPFFNYVGRRRVRLKDCVGVWRMTVGEAEAMVRAQARQLGYTPGQVGMNQLPALQEPQIRGGVTVPRYRLQWVVGRGSGVWNGGASFEVDADRRSIRAIYLQRALPMLTPP